jgi:hypothetical protein
MAQFWIKTFISALMIAGISELGKRSPLMGGLLASLPLTSLLAFIWLYTETRNPANVAQLSISILWLVLPSLLLFLALPFLLKRQMPFYPALILSCVLTTLAYGAMLAALKRFGILTE